MPFPSTLSSLTDPQATDRLNSPSHSAIERAQNSAIEQLEAVIGVEGASSVVGSFQYLVKSPASNGGGHVQTANKGGTGQTSFTKGDILVAQSSSVLTKLAVGATNGFALVADSAQSTGVKWGVPGNVPTIRVYNNPSVLTWSKPSNLAYIEIEVVGGGNAGRKESSGGGGGGGGAYARGFIPASVLNSTVTVTVGSVASLSSFGAHVICAQGNAATDTNGAAGGDVSGSWVSSVFAMNIFDGTNGRSDTGPTPDMAAGGQGGGNVYGQGGDGGKTATGGASGEMVGNPGTGYGAGGGGGITAGAAGVGGAGTQGLVIIREF